MFRWDPSHGKFVLLSQGKPAATELCYPAYSACWFYFFFNVYIIHQTLTWTTGSLVYDLFVFLYCMWGPWLMVSSEQSLVGYRVCTEFWLQRDLPTVGVQTLHKMVAHPCSDLAWLCLTTVFECECSCCVLPTPPDLWWLWIYFGKWSQTVTVFWE